MFTKGGQKYDISMYRNAAAVLTLRVAGGYGPLKKTMKTCYDVQQGSFFLCILVFFVFFPLQEKNHPLQFLKYIFLTVPFVVNGYSDPAEVSSFGP